MVNKILHSWDDTFEFRYNLPRNVVFVFGSNSAGIHGSGSALGAKLYFGALQFHGEGHVGRSYAIPTKNNKIKTLPLIAIEKNINTFLEYALNNPNLNFFITAVGCGRAGYHPEQIAPLFKEATSNCAFPFSWTKYFPDIKFIDACV